MSLVSALKGYGGFRVTEFPTEGSYPMKRTDLDCKNAKPRDGKYKLADRNGLYLDRLAEDKDHVTTLLAIEAKPYGVTPAANRCKRSPSARASASNWFQSSGGWLLSSILRNTR